MDSRLQCCSTSGKQVGCTLPLSISDMPINLRQEFATLRLDFVMVRLDLLNTM